MSRPARGVAVSAYAALCLIWGTTWAAIRIGLDGVPPLTGVALRFGLASVILLILAAIRRIRLGGSRRERALWVVNGLFSFTISYNVVYWCEQWVPSGLAAVLFATFPLFVALLAPMALPGETTGRAEILGTIIGFAGIAVIFSEDLASLGGPRVVTAAAVMLISPLAAAIGSLSVKRWGRGVHHLSLTAIPMGITAGVSGGLALLLERDRAFVWEPRSVGAIVYLAVLGSAVTFSLYFWLLEHLPARRMSLVAYITPLVAVTVGVLRGEPMTARILLGAALVIGGVAAAVQHR